MIRIELSVGSRYLVNRKKIRSCVERVLSEQNVQDANVSVSIVGTRRMTELHVQYMNLEGPTDVLSFPQYDPTQPEKDFPVLPETVVEDEEGERVFPPKHLGDIVVCYPEAVKEAAKRGKMVDDQVCFLVEHGLMHLLGFHHE